MELRITSVVSSAIWYCTCGGNPSASSSIFSRTAFDTANELEPGNWYTARAAVGLPFKRLDEAYVSLPISISAMSLRRSISTPSLRITMLANSSASFKRPCTLSVYWNALSAPAPSVWPTYPADIARFCLDIA